jgi:hypothetical protein
MMNSKRLFAICSFAIGAAAISAVPAGAVSLSGDLGFTGATASFAPPVGTALGNPFTVTFNTVATTIPPAPFNSTITSASGSFNTAATFLGTKPLFSSVAPAVGTFNLVSGSGNTAIYSLASNLDFTFNNGLKVTVGQGSRFSGGFTPGASVNSAGLNLISNVNSSFSLTGFDPTPIQSLTFGFGDTTQQSNGQYFISASSFSTPVPEPFTIIGTLVGGTAALRMRKRLLTAVNK